jgi:1A family penicillin-binding protein
MPTRRYNRHYHKGKEVIQRLFSRKAIPKILTVLGILLLFAAGTVLWWSRDLPDPSNIQQGTVHESTKIYDSTGKHLLYEIGEAKRTYVKLPDMSQHIVKATLAAEDDQFYKHGGIRLSGVLRGIILKPLSGQRAQGGSTITQQLIKNSILSPERTIQRKVKEAVLALELEQRFSKDEILEMYLNAIPYGSRSYGVEAAAQTFFGTSSKDLSVAQAATLAALVQAPTRYSPYGSHLDDLKNRQEYIIGRMSDLGMITKEQAESAKNEKLAFQGASENIQAPHFVFYIKELLDQEYGERVVEQGGLKIITSLDMRLQLLAEEALKSYKDRLKAGGAENASLVAINPKNGDVLAMVGSIDYFDKEIDGNVNVAVRMRSPGSSIKPFVYAAAFQKGYRPDTILVDVNTDFGQGYTPKNYDLAEHGPVSMRVALGNSYNIPAVKTLYLAGVRNAVNLAQAMGLSTLTDPDRYGLSLVLGGGEVRLLDITSAYGVFANEGTRLPSRAILKVEHGNEVLLDVAKTPVQGTEALDAQTARTVTNVLADNNARAAVFGTRSALQLGIRPVAAKTGTTQDFRDGWTVGYTPSLVTGVWTGNNDNSPMNGKSAGAHTAAPIWNAFMRKALEGTPIEQFTNPETPPPSQNGVVDGRLPEVKGKWVEETQTLYTLDCPIDAGQPRTFKELHDILFYVRKADPNGQPPAQAEADPQFIHWESGVATWIAKHNTEKKDDPNEPIYTTSLPTPSCNVGSSEDIPKVRITSPNETVLKSSPVNVKAEIESSHPIKTVRFLLDGQEIAKRDRSDSYEASFSFPTSFSGRKTLMIQAITEDNLIGVAHRTFIINPDSKPPSIKLHTPANNTTISESSFPLTIKTTATDSSGIDFVDILYTKEGSNGTSRVARITTPATSPANRYDTNWVTPPGPGTYIIYAVAYDKTGNITESEHNTITIQ